MASSTQMKTLIQNTKKMSNRNKYLKEFLNLLSDDQVFHSYLMNMFMINQINVLMGELESGGMSEDDVEQEIKNLMDSIDLMVPDAMGLTRASLTREEFYILLKNVKQQTIENLAERRRN